MTKRNDSIITQSKEHNGKFVNADDRMPPGCSLMNSIRVYPDLALASIRLHVTGAFRAWTLAKHLDTDGRGWIERVKLDALAAEMGVKKRTWQYWVEQAYKTGYFMPSHSGGIRLLSLAKVATLLGVERIHRRTKALEKGDAFTGQLWRASVFASTHNGKPTSRKTLRELTGISQRTQARYDKRVKTKRTINIYITDKPASDLPGAIEYGGEATNFAYKGKVAHRRPDSRAAYGEPETVSKRWRINELLSANLGIIPNSLATQRDNSLRVIFIQDQKKAEKAARRNGAKDVLGDVFYQAASTGNNVKEWKKA